MSKTLSTLMLASLVASTLGGCVASVGARSGRPPSGPPPAAPPPDRHRDRDHDRDRPREPRIIEGRVTDAETGQPIDRAAIDITSPAFQGEMTVNTGPDGRYRTQEIPPGEFGIRCRRNGYEVWQDKAVMGNGTARIDFQLQRKR
jgi:Carboxypeptidase regulatory-like domain